MTAGGLRATSALFAAGSAFSIDDVHSDTWQAYLRNWSIPILPGIRGGLVDIPGAVGKADTGTELSSRILSLDVSVFEPNRARLHALLRLFATALDPRTGPHRFELVDEFPGWYINAVPTSDIQTSPSPAAVTAAFTLNLEAADPYFYARTAESVSHRFPAAPQPIVLSNLGSAETPLRITVTPRTGAPGPLTGFTIAVGDKSVTYDRALGVDPTGSSVVIDTGAMTVVRDGTTNDLQYWSGEFPLLPPGETTVVWTDPGQVGGQVTFDYRERLL